MHKKLDNGIEYRGWKITSHVDSIGNAEELAEWESQTALPTLPEMMFGKNHFTFEHNSGFSVSLNTLDALKMVNNTALPDIEVQTAKAWKQGNSAQILELEGATRNVQNFDWTFSTEYKGTVKNGLAESTGDHIDVAKLQQPDPILYYNEVTLFEDELADNGSALLNIKARVMPSCAYCLMRFFLRVDGVLFRLYDTRLFLDFQKNYFVREWTHKESDYNEIVAQLGDELAKVRDPQALSDILQLKTKVTEKISSSL